MKSDFINGGVKNISIHGKRRRKVALLHPGMLQVVINLGYAPNPSFPTIVVNVPELINIVVGVQNLHIVVGFGTLQSFYGDYRWV